MHRSFQERTWQKIYDEERRNTEALKERIASGMAGTPTSRKQAAVEAMTIKPKSNAPEFLQAIKAGAIQEDITNIYTQRAERNDPYWKEEELKELTHDLSRYEKGLPKADVQYKNLGDRLTSRDFYKTLLFSVPMMDESLAMTIGAGVVGAGLIAFGGPIGWAAGGGLIAASIAKATTMESKDEGSSSYQEVYHRSLEEGKTVQEAHRLGTEAFGKTTKANIALLGAVNAAEMALVFLGPQWSALAKASKAGKAIRLAENTIARAGKAGDFAKAGGKILATGEIEGISERLQTGISQWATGQEVDLFSPEAKEAHWAGRVFGATFAGGGMVAQSLRRSGVDPSVDPSKVKVDIGYSGDDLDTPVGGGEVQESVQSGKFPKVSDVDPILEENYLTKIREGLSEDRVTILNNKIMANMDAGMSEDEAVYSAFDDLMAQDKEAQSIIFRAYAETLSEYQGQGEEMFNRFAVYGAVLNKLPQEQRAMLLDTIANTMQETGDADGSLVYDSVMSEFLFTPEGGKIFDSLGLQDGSFWRQRNEELMDSLSRFLGSQEFTDKVKYIEASLARADESALGGLASLVYSSTGGDLNAGLDIFDALYYNGNVDRSLIDQLGNEYINIAKQAQPDFFARQSEVELMNAQGEMEAQQAKEYVGRLKSHTPFVIKYNRALKKQPEEQKAVQQETENVIKDFVNKHPVLQRNLSELTEAYAYAVEPDEKQAKIQELVQKAFGHKVVFFEASPVIDQYGGPKGAFNKETGTVFVNVNSENPAMAVIGHELTHAMIADEGFDKGVFREYLTAVENAGIKDKEYVKGLFDMLDAGADISQEFVEMAGDVMGQAMNSEQFWSNLHKESPRAFEQLYNSLKKIVEYIKSLFTDVAPEHDVKQVFAEADALLQMAEKVGQQYSQHRQSRAVVRTHSILIEGSSGKKSQKQVFFVYDKETDLPIWRADVPGAAGRAEALEVARRINQGEAAPEDIVDEYGEVEAVRKKGETDRKLAAEERQVAEAEEAKKAETDAFAPGTIHVDPRGDKVKVVEQKENTVKIEKMEKENSKPFWVAKTHLKPYTKNELIFGGEIYAGARELENRTKQSGIPSSSGRAEEIWDVRDGLSGLREENDRQMESGRLLRREDKENAGNMVKRLKPQVAQVLSKKKTGASDIYGIGEPSAFFDALKRAKDKIEHGPYVELKSPEEYAGMKLFLTEGGHSGVAVTPDGDIVSLFNNKQESGVRRGSTQLLLNALSEGGKKLDNFDGDLSLIYQQHGFIPVVRVRFDEEFAPPGWKKEWGQPYIIFWVHNGDSPAEVAQKIWNYPVHNFDAVPVVDSGKESYDKAAQIRDELLQRLEEARKGEAPAKKTPVKEKAPETPAKKTFLGISVDVFRKSMAETEEETVEGFRESLSEADYNDYRDLCDGLLGSNLNEKELGNAIEWFEEAYNYLSDILNMSETMSMGERPAYMRNRSEIRSSIKALKEAVAKKTNAKLDDSPLSYDVYSEELAEELIDYLFETDPKDGLYPWKWIQKKIEEEPFTDEALSKKSKDELDANLRYMDAIDRFAASIGVEEESYLSDDSRMFNEEYTLEEYKSEKEAALTAINDARNRITRHIAAAKDNKEPAKPTLPTQEEVDEKLGEVFGTDKHGLYYWYEIVDWVEEMAQAEDAATMQVNLVYLEAALDYAKETPRSKARVGEKGFTEDYTPTDYNKERSEALDALNKAVKGLRKGVKALPQEEILTQEAGGPPTTPAPTTPEAPKKTKKPVEEPIDTAEEDVGPEVDEEAADAETEAEIEAETEAETPDFEASMTKAFDPDVNGLNYWDNIVAWASEVERYAKDGDEATTKEALGHIRKALRLAYDSEEIDPAEAEEWGLSDVYAVEEYNEERSDSIKRLEVISEVLNERLLAITPPKKPQKQGKVIKEQAPQTPKVTKQEKAPKVTTEEKVEESSELDDILSDLDLTLSNADLVSEEELAQLRAQELKDLLDLFDSNPDTGSDTGVEFQSMQRGGINYYERAKQVLSKSHPEALKDLERVKDNPDAIRKLVVRLHNAEEGKATRSKEVKQQEAKQQKAKRQEVSPESKEIAEKTKDLLARGQAKKMLRAKEMDKVKKQFDKINEILASGKELTDKHLATLNKVFVGYNEVMSPTSLEDSVPVRVLKRLGLNLHMGIEKRRNPMTGEQEYKYAWKINGNISTYGEYLYKMNWVYNEVERCYEWVTADANDSPVPRLMEKFGGDEYVQEAQNRTGETDDRGYITRLPRRTDVTRLTGTKYKTGSGKSSKELFVTKGVKANKNPKIKIGKKSWDVLEEHQKDGVALAIQGLDTHGAFILADGTGAGKTAQMLVVAEHYSRSGKDVLLVLHDAKSFKEAFLRDADLLGIPRAKFKFLAATKNADKREKMRKGSINAITYNYLSLGDEPIVQKLGRIPDVVIFDEAHNLKNAYQDDMGRKSSEGVDLSLAAGKVMFVTATVAEKGEHLLYLEKFGFLDKEYGGIDGFMQKMGYYFVENKKSSAPGRWVSRDTNYTTNQMDLLFHELTDAGLFLKRELALDGVSVEVHEYKVGATIRSALDKIVEIVEQGSQDPLSKSRVWRAQRRYLETQKIGQIEELAIKEIEDGRHVIVFAGQVNPTTLIEQVEKGLYDSYWFQEKVRKEANKKRRRDLSKSEKRDLLKRLLQEEVLKKGEIPDGPGTLTELKDRFDFYFREKQEKQGKSPYYSQVAQIYGNIDPMKKEIPKFQNGVARIALATIQKGGVSISLDDTHGNRPRTVIFAVPPFSAIETLQALGRAWRASTKSDVKVIFIKADHAIDDWGFDITRRKLGMLGATGQIDAIKAVMALDDSPVGAGELTGIGTRKETPTVTYDEEGVAEFQEGWRSRHKAALDEANRLKSLKGLHEANDYYYENRIKESKAAGNDAVTNRLRKEKQNVAEHLEVMSEVRDNSINFFVDYFASQARASRPTQPVGAETVAEQPGTETEGSQPVKQERILDTIARIFNTKINDPEERKLALTPGEALMEGAQGMGFALGEGALQDAAIEIKRSVDNVKMNPLEKFLAKDNLMNVFLMGAIQYQEDVNGEPLTTKEKWRYYKSMAYYKTMRNAIDDKAALRLMEELACGKIADADNSIYKLARMYGGIENRTYHKLLKDFRKTAELLTDEEGNYSDEMEHVVAKLAIATHAMDVNKFFRDKAENKREDASGFSDERIQELLDEVNAELAEMPEGKRQKVGQAHRELVKFYQKVLDDMLEGEVITEKTYNTLKEAYPSYVPMFRHLKNSKIIDFDPAKDIKDAVSFEGVLEPIMGRKGSTLPIQDMLSNAMESYTRAQRAIEMNNIIRKMDRIIEGFAASGMEGAFVKRYNNVPVLKNMYVVQEDGREVPASGFTEEDLEALEAGTVIRSKSRDRATFVVGKEKGKIVIYEAHSEVIAALQTMSRQLDDNWVWKVAKGFGDVLRTGATATPEFWVKNAFKDTFHGYQATDSGVTFKDLCEATLFLGTPKEDPRLQALWEEFLEDSAGMGNFLHDIVSRHNNFYREVTGRKSMKDYSPIRWQQEKANVAENISRFAEYVKARETGASRKEAAFRAIDQQDFGMAGTWIRPVNSVIPFFNSPIQSKYKLWRQFKKNPKEFSIRAMWANIPITLVSMALRALASDDQKRRIDEAHSYIRVNYWLVPIPFTDAIVRIPKPFDTSMLFANTLETFLEYVFDKDPATATQYMKEWATDNFMHSVMPSSMFPQVLNVMGEASTGFNQFYGMNSVPASLQDELAMHQYTSETPHLLIGWGRLMGSMGFEDAGIASPIAMQSLINTTFGGLGTLTLDLTDMAIEGANYLINAIAPVDVPTYREKMVGERPYTEDIISGVTGMDAESLPMLRVFLLKDDYGTSMNKVYRKWDTLEKQKQRHDRLIENGQVDAAYRAMPDKDWNLYWYLKECVDIRNTFGPANSLIRTFRDTPYLSPAEKGYWIKEIEKERGRLARETLVFIKMYEAGLTPEVLTEQYYLNNGLSSELKAKVKLLDEEFGKYIAQTRANNAAKE